MFASVIVLTIVACVNAEYRILGGTNTTIEEFPHQVALEYDTMVVCGGAIIGPKHILTAGHCLRGVKYVGFLKIRIGSTYRRKGGSLYDVAYTTSYPAYSTKTQDGDVGVITLAEEIAFKPNAQPISIVPEGQEPQHGEMLTVTGWGRTGMRSFGMPSVLQVVRLPCIRRDMCSTVFKDENDLQVTKNMVCAGGGVNKGSYQGDSGGALINSKRQVVGIVSWGMTGSTTGYPRVYTNVAIPAINTFIRDFINKNR